MDIHHLFIQRCFELARLAAGKVNPNPMVGAIIVHEGKIIGEGYHQFPGGPHAEIMAINSLKNKELLSKSTIYISLEPCNNFGKTPPCVDTILKYKIPEVYISIIDPNPLTKGKSIQKLEAAGVKVTENIFPKKGKDTTIGFFSMVEKGRPFIFLKFAQTLNKKIGKEKTSIWISNAFTKRLTHKWRSETNAIIVGTGTILSDDPKLDNRLYYGNSPVKLLIKRDGQLPKNLAAFQSKGKTIVICEKIPKNKTNNSTLFWEFPFDGQFLNLLLKKLKQEGLNSLMVEGGAKLINSFIAANLWDEARIFTSNSTIRTKNSIPAPKVEGKIVHSMKIGDNQLTILKNEKPDE